MYKQWRFIALYPISPQEQPDIGARPLLEPEAAPPEDAQAQAADQEE